MLGDAGTKGARGMEITPALVECRDGLCTLSLAYVGEDLIDKVSVWVRTGDKPERLENVEWHRAQRDLVNPEAFLIDVDEAAARQEVEIHGSPDGELSHHPVRLIWSGRYRIEEGPQGPVLAAV
jgi:hypothetical protein